MSYYIDLPVLAATLPCSINLLCCELLILHSVDVLHHSCNRVIYSDCHSHLMPALQLL